MYTKFRIEWDHRCYLCQNPLDVQIQPNIPTTWFIICLRTFKRLYPFGFINNSSIYKFFGQKVRRVCICCYDGQPEKVPVDMINRREVLGKKIRIRSGSKTDRQIYDWFESFNRFINKPDINEILTDPITSMSSEFLRLSDERHRRRYHTELSEQLQ